MDWILYLAALFLVMFSQIKVQGAYARYRQVMTLRGYTGAQVARRILDDHGLQHVQVEPSPGGALSDHYDPKANVVRLSEDIYANSSIASVAVAAHECGHAIQHAENYGFIALRNSILPFAMVSSQLSWLVLILGLLFSSTGLFYTGVWTSPEGCEIRLSPKNNIRYAPGDIKSGRMTEVSPLQYVISCAIMHSNQITGQREPGLSRRRNGVRGPARRSL